MQITGAATISLALVLVVCCASCSPAARQRAGAAISGATVGTSTTSQYSKLMLFGGDDHKTYLGCLNCSQYAQDSIFNKYGEHGSPYSANSIWNRYGGFGSKYAANSACNAYAVDPPVIVNQEGAYYGRLTLNRYHSEIGVGRRYLD